MSVEPEDETLETDRGRAMFEELLWVHSMIRRDLQTVERLAGDVADGLSGEAVEDALGELKSAGPLWRLKVNCLRYCRFVHAHHGAEDALLFPVLRASVSSTRCTSSRASCSSTSTTKSATPARRSAASSTSDAHEPAALFEPLPTLLGRRR